MSFQHLRNQIKTKLQALTEIQNVYDYPTNDFSGYPAAVIQALNNESDYETTCENERHYIFKLYIWQETEFLNERDARRKIEYLADLIIDTFDKDELLTGISMPAGKTILGIRPALAEIVPAEKYIYAEIDLTIKVSFDKNI